MRGRGFAAQRDKAGNAVGVLASPSYVGDAPGQQVTRELMLLGHIDTVAGYPPVVCRDGKLYGRGAVDAKGPLAAFATAANLVGARSGWRIVVVGAVEEEAATSKGARAIVRTHRPDMVIIGEPTGWQKVALGYKGRLLADLTVRRPMSHRAGPEASAPERAIAYWNSVAGRLEQLNAGRERIWDRVQGTLRGFATSDDGLEELASLQLGFRLPLHLSPEQLKDQLRDLANGHSLSFHGEETAFRAEKNTPLVRAFLRAVRDHGGEPGFVVKTGTSDMNVVGPAWDCPIAAYGPGESALDHTPDEHVNLAEWQMGVAVLAEAIRRVTAE
jgi:LysW-gamma-L-lysine carboxypeptidase